MKTITSFDELPLLLSVSDLQVALGVSRFAAYNLVHQQGFPCVRIGRSVRIPKEALQRWLENKLQENLDTQYA